MALRCFLVLGFLHLWKARLLAGQTPGTRLFSGRSARARKSLRDLSAGFGRSAGQVGCDPLSSKKAAFKLEDAVTKTKPLDVSTVGAWGGGGGFCVRREPWAGF